ncbi:MAG: hypothetical protein WBF58_00395 [Xanthobacteraceae bacterium]
MAEPRALLVVEALQAWYGESHILHGVSFEVRAGEVVTLLGRNGVGLAPVIIQQIGRTIGSLKAQGFTILLVEQNFHFAAAVADRYYVMEHGRIVDQFSSGDLKSNIGKLHDYLGV